MAELPNTQSWPVPCPVTRAAWRLAQEHTPEARDEFCRAVMQRAEETYEAIMRKVRG